LGWQSGRPPWESVFAFVNWSVNAPHNYTAPYFQDAAVGNAYGWVFTGLTPPLNALLTPVPAGPAHWEGIVSGIGMVLTLVAGILAAKLDSARSLVRWSLFGFCALLAWNIGWSPQY